MSVENPEKTERAKEVFYITYSLEKDGQVKNVSFSSDDPGDALLTVEVFCIKPDYVDIEEATGAFRQGFADGQHSYFVGFAREVKNQSNSLTYPFYCAGVQQGRGAFKADHPRIDDSKTKSWIPY